MWKFIWDPLSRSKDRAPANILKNAAKNTTFRKKNGNNLILIPIQYQVIQYQYSIDSMAGWYLSMDKDDSFFKRLENNEHPFGSDGDYNKKSLGFVLVCSSFWCSLSGLRASYFLFYCYSRMIGTNVNIISTLFNVHFYS